MSLRKRFGTAEVESIYSAANSAIWHSHHLAHGLATGAPREEDFVATLVTDGVKILDDRWREILSPKGIDLAVAGVFCHGHPQVDFDSAKNPVELADLLIVHFNSSKARITARALLIQAKISSKATRKLPRNDPQLILYSSWPPFEFVTGGLKPGLRYLRESGKGSRYALVHSRCSFPEDITWADQCPWASCAAREDLAAERSLSKLLGDVLLEKDGRRFCFKKPRDEWSRTISELLEITGKKTYRRKNIGRGDTPRLSAPVHDIDDILYFTGFSDTLGGIGQTFSREMACSKFFGLIPEIQDNGDEEFPPLATARSDNHGGISTLIIETREGDYENRRSSSRV